MITVDIGDRDVGRGESARVVRLIAKELANLPADKDVKRVVLPEPKPFLQSIFGDDDSSSDAKNEQAQAAILDALPADIRNSFRYASLLDRMQRGEAMLFLPFQLEIK